MPRGLSAAAKAYGGPFLWAVKLTLLDATVRHFATDALTFLGTSYTAYLGRVGDIKQTRSLQADGGEISLLNADLFIGGLLQSKAFEGALCELKQLLLGIEQEILVFKGRLAEQQEGDEEVSFQLVSELDPGQVKLHQRRYAQLCTWQFGRPARLTPCGYNPVAVGDVAESFIGERTADIFSSLTIGDSTLNEAPDAHKDRIVVLSFGTGRGQKRRIKSNTATTFTLYHPWTTNPDGTTKFRVFLLPAGAPRVLLTSSSAKLETLATAATARSLTDTGLSMQTDEHAGELVYIVSGAGATQSRKIGSNTATVITIAADQADFSPAPQAGDKYRVLFSICPKDFAPSCEDRVRTQAFNGYPTLAPLLRRQHGGVFAPGGGGLGGGGRAPRSGAKLVL